MTRVLVVLVLLAAAGCGAAPDMTQEEARPLLHSAASIPKALLNEVTAAGASISIQTLSTCPFSMLLSGVEIGETEDLRRLSKKEDPPLKPSEIWLPVGTDRLTVIPLEGLTEIEITTEGDQANGTFRFRREKILEGRGEFTAERIEDGWKIVEFRIPAAKAKTSLKEDGSWKASEQ